MRAKTKEGARVAKRLTVEEAAGIMAGGGLIIMTDDEDRENEGDLIGAARHAEPAMVNFMASNGKGLICCALEGALCDRAGLTVQTASGEAVAGAGPVHETAFCESVDLIDGCSTGISAFDRSASLKRLADKDCRLSDFARPGHTFPIREADGGLNARQGHTEGSVELCRIAGLEGAAVICEIMDDDGEMARWDRLNEMGANWGLGILTIKDLIEWKRERN